jgi:acetylornithine deacetylase
MQINKYDIYFAIQLLGRMIAIPSLSKQEDDVVAMLIDTIDKEGYVVERYLNNIWLKSLNFKADLPTILFNSHVDTVKPNAAYTKNPYEAIVEDGKLYGLGSNDAGGSVVCQLVTFLNLAQTDLPFNLVWTATAEEEISGQNGIAALLASIAFQQSLQGSEIIGAIVGEPTEMKMAVAERGLLVIDAKVKGVAGHAANNTGDNALYKAMEDIQFLKQYNFEKVSPYIGPVKLSVTSINTPNIAHNVIPDECNYIVDVRLNECYTHQEVLDFLQSHCYATLTARSMRMKATIIPDIHPIVKAGNTLGLESYGSPTSSDKALIPYPTLKLGPGLSLRSHTSDEFIYISDLQQGIDVYSELIKAIKL